MSQIKDLIVSVHNTFQFTIWLCTFYLTLTYIQTGKPKCWQECLTIAQSEQLMELVFSIIGITRNSPVTVAMQVVTRWCIVVFIMPHSWNLPEYENYIFMALIPWCMAECVRYPFYQFKSMQKGFLGDLRYNLFIPLYPIGVTGELFCYANQMFVSMTLPADQKPMTVHMPNKWNFAFEFEYFIMIGIPIIYILSFPPLYMSVWRGRAKFYKERKEEALAAKKTN